MDPELLPDLIAITVRSLRARGRTWWGSVVLLKGDGIFLELVTDQACTYNAR